VFSNHFDVLMSKIIFKNNKKIILMHFQIKNTLKINRNHTLKHARTGSGKKTGQVVLAQSRLVLVYYINLVISYFMQNYFRIKHAKHDTKSFLYNYEGYNSIDQVLSLFFRNLQIESHKPWGY
jgi:hypothetical protein